MHLVRRPGPGPDPRYPELRRSGHADCARSRDTHSWPALRHDWRCATRGGGVRSPPRDHHRTVAMKAYVYGANGAEITDIEQPSPKGTQVLVRVHACGLNRADLGMTKGHVHGAAGGVGTVLGMDWAGEIAELGPEAKGVNVGDKVMGSGGAAFAEYTLADHGRLFRAPSNMNFDEAATLPIAITTMHNAVVTNGALQAGQTVMVQGASSGVGLMAMQIAKLKGASLVVGSSTDAGRRARLKNYGADLAVDSSDPNWVDQVLEATDGQGVDLIVDQVSGTVANQNLKATK